MNQVSLDVVSDEKSVWKKIVINGEEWNYEVSNKGELRVYKTKKIRALNHKKQLLACTLSKNGEKRDFYDDVLEYKYDVI